MKRKSLSSRGFSLLAALLIVMVVTMLVLGAIAFTGTERVASVQQTREAQLSSCTQAARNLFLSQVRVLQGNIYDVRLDAGIPQPDGTQMRIESAHYSGSVNLTTLKQIRTGIGTSVDDINDRTNRAGRSPLMAGYYVVGALCREKAGGPEQEIEFTVRVGL